MNKEDFDFDCIIDRRHTGSLKYDFFKERGMPEGLIPMWVADMDFKTAPSISKALESTAQSGIFGYSEPKPEYYDAMHKWFSEHFSFSIDKDSHIQTPGVVFAIAHAVKAFTNPHDSIIIQPPVYYPFSEVVNSNDRKLIENPLKRVGDTYEIDFLDFEQKIIAHNVKMFIFCSPHNPVGRVWTYSEIYRLSEICLKHNVFVVSDEIHADFVYSESKHFIFSTVNPKSVPSCMICTSRGKSFNQAGLQVSDIFIFNTKYRELFLKEITRSGYSQRNTFGLVGARVAYEAGDAWLSSLIAYLEENRNFIKSYLNSYFPELTVTKCEGTFLSWLDFSKLKIPHKKLASLIVSKAKLWLDDGLIFDKNADCFFRLNFGCPKQLLARALEQLTLIRNSI
ncbi:MAG: pyridoxal phosphate-dependent aminotransferase [Christensenellaceae bacterium]|jgi:cystathionine beta-lyase|nr:pyridoxal phosphate-dependent aminotransferase [Christensenellaceae bacterium]